MISPAYTRPSTPIAGEDTIGRPVEKFHICKPVLPFSAYKLKSSEPMYTTPPVRKQRIGV